MAFPPKTELLVIREGNPIIIEPWEQTLEDVPALFSELNSHFKGNRLEFIETERDW